MTIKNTADILLVNGDSIPNELKRLKQWVTWRAELDEVSKLYTKVLYQTNGINRASSIDPKTWDTFDSVIDAYENGVGEGIGFVLTESDPYACIDIDGLEDINYLPVLAEEIVSLSYSEISPSGEGLHVWVKFQHDSVKYKNKNTQLGYEIYSNKRFITFTGEAINDLPINEGEKINRFIEKVFKREERASTMCIENRQDGRGKAILPEDKIIKIAEKSKSGNRFKLFMYGGWENKYQSASDADMAFCNDLAFWTNCDYRMMDSIYRKSSIYADRKGSTDLLKWDRQQNSTTYGDETLQKAIHECRNTFKPTENQLSAMGEPMEQILLPKGYAVKGEALFHITEKFVGGEMVQSEQMICRQAPYISRSFSDVETGNLFYEIAWTDNNNQQKTIVPASGIATKKELVALSNRSLAVTENNAKQLITYFDLYNMVNKRQREYLVSRIGHIKGKFIHPSIVDGVTIMPGDIGEKQLLESVHANGSTDEWLKNILEPIKSFPKALLMVLASFASVLLNDLKLDPFIIDFAGETSNGKTTLLKACASVWGKRHFMSEWNITPVSLERKTVFLNSFPLLLDDSRKITDERRIKDFIYNFSGGRSKGRGSTSGSQQEYTWNNILISTGEASLNAYAEQMGGVAARIVAIDGIPFPGVEPSFYSNLHNNVDEYYGAIGIEFLNKWLQHRDKLIPEFQSCVEICQLKAQGNPVVARVARNYAVLIYTAKILNTFFQTDIEPSILFKVFDELVSENKALDKPKQLLELLLQELDSNRSSIFYKHEPVTIKAIYKDGFLFLSPSFLKEFLGVEEKSIRATWLKREYTIGKNEKGKIVDYHAKKVSGKTYRVIQINPDIIKELGFDFSQQLPN